MATEREKLLNIVNGRLWGYAGHVKAAQGKLSDGAEELSRGLLDRMLGCKLRNMNREKKNFPGIDLGDDSEGVKLCVQVTSDGSRDKVKHTLKEFFEEKLHERFDRLIVLVVGNAQKFTGETEVKYGFDFQTKRDIWDTARLVQEIEALDDDRLESVAEFLKNQLQDYRWEAPEKDPLDLPLRTAMNERNFVGRERELAEIAKRFETERVVVLSGLGGMGKTELAVRFGRDYVNQGKGRAYFVRYNGSFEQTVRENVAPKVEGLTTEGKTEQQIFAEAMTALKRCGPDDLLILDNADQEASLSELRYALSELPMRVLITTRARSKGAMPLRAIDREKLHLIFLRHTEDVTVEQMDMLIDTVKGHTMTVDLIARTLGDPMAGVTPEEIRRAMTGSRVSEADYPDVDTDYERDMQQRQIYAHLTALFQLRGITPAERGALCCATLLPADGMETKLFLDALPAEAKTAARSLEKRGWLQCENKLVAIHPVVRMVCRRQLNPTEEDCEAFLNGLWDWYDSKNPYEKDKYLQLAELFTTASKDLMDPEGDWAINAGIFWNKLGEARRALDCNLQAAAKLEKNCPDSEALARAYNNVGSTYGYLGDHARALEYQLKSLAIREKVLPPEHPSLAASYNNVGGTYGYLGDHARALEYQLKALTIQEKVLPPEHPDLAISYNNVGNTYGNLGDHARALEYLLKALTIREKVLPPEHPDLAASYNNVGITYGYLGDHARALEYQLKALGIWEKVLPPEHPFLATSYNNVGITYGDLGDHARALEYKLKDLAICEKVLPPEHPDLATSYNNVGSTYGDLGDHARALEYQLKALGIWEKVLPPEHPSLAISYNNVGSTYGDLGDHARALEYKLKALTIREKVLPPEHPDLAASYNNVGSTYGNLGDHARALEYKLKALTIQEKVLPLEHPYNIMCCNNIAMTYAKMEDFSKASEYADKALEKAERSMQGHPNLERYRKQAEMMKLLAMLQEMGIDPNDFLKKK